MTSRSEKKIMEHSKASGIVRDNISGSAFIPATQVLKLEIFYKYSIIVVTNGHLASRWIVAKSATCKRRVCST